MVAGGAESAICMLGVGGFAAMKACPPATTTPPQPPSVGQRARRFVMGEGAGVLVLEELEHAKRRGARIYAELAGFGASSDAHHITAPSGRPRAGSAPCAGRRSHAA